MCFSLCPCFFDHISCRHFLDKSTKLKFYGMKITILKLLFSSFVHLNLPYFEFDKYHINIISYLFTSKFLSILLFKLSLYGSPFQAISGIRISKNLCKFKFNIQYFKCYRMQQLAQSLVTKFGSYITVILNFYNSVEQNKDGLSVGILQF